MAVIYRTGKPCNIETGSKVLTRSYLKDGAAVGAMSLIKGNTDPWSIYAGIPAHIIRTRKRNILNLERQFRENGNEK